MTLAIQDPRAQVISNRIWNAFPVTEPTFAKLLGLLDIEVTESVPTAAVSLGATSRLRINPDFIDKHCRTDAALVMLVLHELWHVALGHTRLYKRITPAQNWAFDAIINAQLCRLFRDNAHTRLFRDLYDPRKMPWALLRPPEGWGSIGVAWLPGRVGEVHRQLYSDASVSTEELFRLLPTLEAAVGKESPLLGSHDGVADDEETSAPPEVMREIRGIIAEWPMLEQRSGRDLGREATAQRISLAERREDAVRILRRSMAGLARVGYGSGAQKLDEGRVESLLPYGRDRAAWLREAWGDAIPLHRTELPHRTLTRQGQVHVYLDVSGSMDVVIAPLYAALASLAPWLAPQVQLFSTQIDPMPIAGLRRGKLISTGGTTIDCVTAHILESGIERALIVTDGWVGSIPGEHLNKLKQKRVRIQAAITANGDANFMAPLCGRVDRLPRLN